MRNYGAISTYTGGKNNRRKRALVRLEANITDKISQLVHLRETIKSDKKQKKSEASIAVVEYTVKMKEKELSKQEAEALVLKGRIK